MLPHSSGPRGKGWIVRLLGGLASKIRAGVVSAAGLAALTTLWLTLSCAIRSGLPILIAMSQFMNYAPALWLTLLREIKPAAYVFVRLPFT